MFTVLTAQKPDFNKTDGNIYSNSTPCSSGFLISCVLVWVSDALEVQEYKPLMLPIKSLILSIFTVKSLHLCLYFRNAHSALSNSPFSNCLHSDYYSLIQLLQMWLTLPLPGLHGWASVTLMSLHDEWLLHFHWPEKDRFRKMTVFFLGNAFYCHNRLHLYGVKMSEEQNWLGVQHLPLASFLSFF